MSASLDAQPASGARPTLRDIAPFALVAALGLGGTLLPPYQVDGATTWAMLAAFAATGALFTLSLRRRERSWLDPAGPLLFFVALALARDLTGGVNSHLTALLVLPFLWLALTGTKLDLWLASALTPLVFVVPIVLVGGADYPLEDWRRALGWTAFGLFVSPVIQRIVRRLSQETGRARKAEARWRVLLDHLPDATVLMVDRERTIRLAAGASSTAQGFSGTEGRPLAEISNATNFAILDRLVEDAFAGHEGGSQITATHTGNEHNIVVTPLPPDDEEEQALILARDVSVESARERALVRAKQRAERLFADAPHGIAVLDPRGTIRQGNDALAMLVGSTREALVGRRLAELSRSDDLDVAALLEQLAAADHGGVETDWTLRTARGDDVQVALSGRALAGDAESDDVVLVHLVDVSERRRYEQRLAHLADHDALTGLANRRRFERELEQHLDRCRRYGPTGALLLLDLDQFKEVNDTLGHAAGDQLLVSTAQVLRAGVRSHDLVARLGGDEFAVLLTDADQDATEAVAASIVTRVREHTATLDGVTRRVTASVGAVTMQAAAGHTVDVLALADMTMYDAKEAGRDRYVVLEEVGNRPPRSGARMQWKSRIERALEQDEFVLHLQPILDLRTGLVRSAEALLRLRDHDQLIPPRRFLYVAERAGLAPAVDRWVVENAVGMLAGLRTHDPGFRLEVNLSGLSIGDAETEQAIVASLDRHRVDPAGLILEITETAAVADVGLARGFAERMTALGCPFALDDFGAGFGSFYYLKHLIFDFVKIDGEFVSNCHRSEVDRTILRSIVGIAHDLGKQAVAEFVSEPAVLDVVRAEGVDHAQGFLIGEPVPYDEFVQRFAPGASPRAAAESGTATA